MRSIQNERLDEARRGILGKDDEGKCRIAVSEERGKRPCDKYITGSHEYHRP